MLVNKIKKLIKGFFMETNLVSPSSQNLNKYVVFITGGTKGIGKGIAKVLLREGAQLAILARNTKEIEDELENNENVLLCDGDISSVEQVNDAVKKALERFGKIDVLINNAGTFITEKFLEEITESEFDKILSTNVKGMFIVTKAVLPIMKKQKEGLIINIGSKISHNTNVTPKKVLYTSTKYAVEGFSLALRKELKQFGIRVTCLMPGTTNTFISLKSKEYMSPLSLGFVVEMLIKSENLDFESIIVKSKNQNL